MNIILNIRNNIPQLKYRVNSKRYEWPNPYDSEEQAQIFSGADIENMTDLERWKEAKRLESVLPWVDDGAILIVDLTGFPARIITKQAWGLERMKLLKRGVA